MDTKTMLDTIINVSRDSATTDYSSDDRNRIKQAALKAIEGKGGADLERLARDGSNALDSMLARKSGTSEEFGRAAVAAAAADRLQRMKEDAEIFGRLNAIPAGGANDADQPRKGLFTPADADRLVSAFKSGTVFKTEVPFGAKAPILGTGLTPASGTYVAPARLPGAHISLADLLTPQTADGPVVRYYRMGSGSVGVVAEGAAKPDAGVGVTPVDGTLVKLASTFRYSDELGEDAAFLVPKIGDEVIRATLAAENAQIVAAWNTVSGAQAATAAAASIVDDLLTAFASSEAYLGMMPTHVIANPVQVAAIRKAKATTAGSYHLDPTGGPTSLAGVPVISTPTVPAGTVFIITGPEHGVFYRRGQLRVEAGHSGADFAENMVTVRVEERVLPAITEPHRVMEVTVS